MPLDCSAVNGSKVSEVVSTVATFKCPDPHLDLLLDCPAVNAQLTFCQIVTGVYFQHLCISKTKCQLGGSKVSELVPTAATLIHSLTPKLTCLGTTTSGLLDCAAAIGSEVSELVAIAAIFDFPNPQLDLNVDLFMNYYQWTPPDCAAGNAQLTFCQIVTGVYLQQFMHQQEKCLAGWFQGF